MLNVICGLALFLSLNGNADTIVRLVHPVLGIDYYGIEFSTADHRGRGPIGLRKESALAVIRKCGSTNLVEGRDYVLSDSTLLDMSLEGLKGNWYYEIKTGPNCP